MLSTHERRGDRLPRRLAAAAALLHVAVAVAILHVAWTHPASSIAGPSVIDAPGSGAGGIANGDSVQLVWFLRWTPFAVGHLHDPLYTRYLNAPTGANLMWDALMPVAGLALAPVTLIAGPALALNLLVTLAVAGCGVTATLCARRFVRSNVAAVASGLAYECSAYVVAQAQGHDSVVLAAALVPCVLLLFIDGALTSARTVRSAGVLLGIVAAVMFYTWEETLLGLAVVGTLGLALAAALNAARVRALLGRVAAVLAVGGLVSAVLATPGLLVQFGAMHLTAAGIRQADVWVIDLQNLVVPTKVEALAPRAAALASHAWTGNSFEWGGYAGIPLLAVMLATLVSLRRRRCVLWLGAMYVVSILLAFGPTLHVGGQDTRVPMPWALLAHVPLVRDILAARLAVFPALAAALLLGIAVDELLARRRAALAAAICAVVAATLLPAALPAQGVRAPAFFTGADARRIPQGATVLVAPWATPLAMQAMYWQAASGMRFAMPSGYVSLPAPGASLVESPLPTPTSTAMTDIGLGDAVTVTDSLRTQVLGDLARWRVSTVIVGPMAHAGAMVAFFRSVLGSAPRRVGGVDVWWTA